MLNCELFEIGDGKLIYNNQTTDTQTIVEAVDGGIRQIININSPNSPKSYKFPIDFELGDKLEINDDKSAIVKSVDNTTKIIILKPWAVDANGKNLKTWYNVDKNNPNTLIQHIDFEDAVFPVLADPTWCGEAVKDVEWVWRTFYVDKGAWSLKLKPTWCLNWHGRTPWSAWEDLYAKIPFHQAWPGPTRFHRSNSYWSMYNQFACHRDWVKWNNLFNMLKSVSNLSRLTRFEINEYQNYYHLESERPGYWGSKDASCNQRNDLVGKII